MTSTTTMQRLVVALIVCVGTLHDARGSEPLSKPTPPDPLVEPLLTRARYTAMTLSPDGTKLAALGSNGEATAVVVTDLATHQHTVFAASRVSRFSEWKNFQAPIHVQWLNDEMIAVDFWELPTEVYSPDGKPLREIGWKLLYQGREAGRLSDWVVVWRDSNRDAFSRVNVRTGETRKVNLDLPERDMVHWTADSSGAIRMVETISTAGWNLKGRLTQWYRADESSPWQKVDEYGIADPDWTPLIVPVGAGNVIALANNGLDAMSLWNYDPVKHAFGELMATHDTDDLRGIRVDRVTREPQSVTTYGLRPQTIWLDAQHAALQQAMDAALPDHVNVLAPTESNRTLVYSYSDRDPGRWYVFDSATHKLLLVGARHPEIDPKRMSPMQTLRYRSFDGTTVPAYLTLPGSTQAPGHPLPMVVVIHGGPQERDAWRWDGEVQALAAHGYAVFQPQFRGSTGFGRKFELAGYGQWGQAMQDDITAGVRDLIARHVADPARICIVGSGFGGYAAMWGLEKDPQLYKCGVSNDGIHDIGHLMYDKSEANATQVGREWMRMRVGDWSVMKDTFDSVSPRRHADRVTAPVLLVHSDARGRLTQEHTQLMRDALQDEKKDVQWLHIPIPESEAEATEATRRYFAALFGLLARTIGRGEPPFPPAAEASGAR